MDEPRVALDQQTNLSERIQCEHFNGRLRSEKNSDGGQNMVVSDSFSSGGFNGVVSSRGWGMELDLEGFMPVS